MSKDNDLIDLAAMDEAPVSVAMAIATVALNMAIRYHGYNVVTDGALYQQYKLEGRNMRELDIGVVFETAKRIERHLLEREKAISVLIANTLVNAVREDRKTTLADLLKGEKPTAVEHFSWKPGAWDPILVNLEEIRIMSTMHHVRSMGRSPVALVMRSDTFGRLKSAAGSPFGEAPQGYDALGVFLDLIVFVDDDQYDLGEYGMGVY